MTHQSQLEKDKYRNWVRAGLGLLYVKEGLEPFCDDIVKQQHADLMKRVKPTATVSTLICGKCNLRTLKANHVRDPNRQCPLGQANCNCQHPGGKIACPNNVCGTIYDEIIKLHASRPPAPFWKNTDSLQWCTDPWSIARCFINAPGYKDKLTVSDTDCSGILHVLINNKGLHNHIQCPITGTDVFSEVRKYRNSIFHGSGMELEDNDVNRIIDDMIAVLQDGKELNARTESQTAVKKLLELKNEDFIITTKSEAQILNGVLEVITSKEKEIVDSIDSKQNELKQMETETKREVQSKSDEVKGTLNKRETEIKGNLEDQCTKVSGKLQQKCMEATEQIEQRMQEFETRASNSLDEINESEAKRRKIDETLSRKVDILEEQMSEQRKQIQELLNLRKELEAKKCTTEEQLDYIKKKEDIQTRLIKLYEENVVSVPVLPLHPGKNMKDIDTVYFAPWLEMETCRSQVGASQFDQKKTETISMHEIFSNNDKRVRLIYILGEAGSGKSTLCIYLVRQWCTAHASSKASHKNESDSEIVKAMKSFDFLLYITLRHNADCDSIKQMLDQQYGDQSLDKILENESCLILLDGLDEWTQDKQMSQFQSKGLPTRDHNKGYTIITTTRPWKFETLGIKDTEVQKKITLKGLNELFLENMTDNFIGMLNQMFQKTKQTSHFKEKLAQNPVSKMSHVPIIIQQYICLWFDDRFHGTSVSATYSSMLELFFDWADLKTMDVDIFATESDLSQDEDKVWLPKYLKSSDRCSKFQNIINCLSMLAFETLFCLKQENQLSFTSTLFQHLKISTSDVNCFLKTGILCKDRCVTFRASSRQTSSFSFLHKTVQEYLAAVYISIQFEKLSDVRLQDKCRHFVEKYFVACTTVEDILRQANVFIMLCGLVPQLLTDISEYINKIVTSDTRFATIGMEESIGCRFASKFDLGYGFDFYAKNTPVEDRPCFRVFHDTSTVDEVQSLMGRCVDEVAATGHRKQSINLANIFINGDNLPSLCLYEEVVIPQSVLKLYVFASTLTKRVIQILSQMSNLISLKIAPTNLSDEDCGALITLLEQFTQLREMSISVGPTGSKKHMLDMSKHDKLELFQFAIWGFSVDNLPENLRTDTVGNSRKEIVIRNNSNIRKYKVRSLHVNCYSLECFYLIEAEDPIFFLHILLPPLMNVNTLKLQELTVINPVFSHPSDIDNLRQIKLTMINMNIETWKSFIDTLPTLPNDIEVETEDLRITTSIDNETTDDWSDNEINIEIPDGEEKEDLAVDKRNNNSNVNAFSDDSTANEGSDDSTVNEFTDDPTVNLETDDSVRGAYDFLTGNVSYVSTVSSIESQLTDEAKVYVRRNGNVIHVTEDDMVHFMNTEFLRFDFKSKSNLASISH